MGYQPGDDPHLARPITTKEDLNVVFRESYKKPEDVMIGMEVELHGIHRDTYKPITYLGQTGLRAIQGKLIDELGWQIHRQEGKYLIDLVRSGTHLMLESSEAMSELSGRTHPSIHTLSRELSLYQHELSKISEIFNVVWLGIGFEPFAKIADIKDIHIKRFDAVDAAEAGKKKKKNTPWQGIASVQSNIDYLSEDDARRKFQTLLRLAPFIAAMYAHSPLEEGKDSGFVSYRTNIVRSSNARRRGIRKIFFSPHFGFDEWVDFCMRAPMVAIVRDGTWIPLKRLTFSQFLKSGYDDFEPCMEDWMLHLSFIYTDARIRDYIELRVCDSVPPFLIPSMQAIVKAFVYHEDGEQAMKHITKGWRFRDFAGAYRDIALHGMDAEIKGKKMLSYCKEILDVATTHLVDMKVLNEKDENEAIYLSPIKDFVFVKEKSPGAWVMSQWEGEWNKNPEKLIEWCTKEKL